MSKRHTHRRRPKKHAKRQAEPSPAEHWEREQRPINGFLRGARGAAVILLLGAVFYVTLHVVGLLRHWGIE